MKKNKLIKIKKKLEESMQADIRQLEILKIQMIEKKGAIELLDSLISDDKKLHELLEGDKK